MTTYIASIGRGTPDQANYVRGSTWLRFTCDLVDVAEIAGHIHFSGEGTGRYVTASGDTIYEESFTVIFDGPADPADIISNLAILARNYCQECIALTSGETVFVEPR